MRQPPRRGARARRAAVLCLLTASLLALGSASADPGTPDPAPHPTLGTLSRNAVLMGAAPAGAAGEAWAYEVLPTDTPPPGAATGPRAFAPSAGSPYGQLVFERYTTADGVWGIAQTPATASGDPYRGFAPNSLSARITPGGGGVLIGSDATQPNGQQVVVLAADPGGRFTVLPRPDATVLHPAVASIPAETLATNGGSGRVAAAAVESGGHTQVLAGILGPAAETAVAHWDGTAWTREPITVPSGSSGSFRILAVAAASLDNAWLLAQEDPASGAGIALFHRVTGPGGPVWDPAAMPPTVFDHAATASRGISGAAALGGQAQPLTVGPHVVWVDLRFNESAGGGHGSGGTTFDATVGYDLAGHTAATLCDAADPAGQPVCDHRLGMQFDDALGYRSFAFDGDGLGSRVITDILPANAPAGAVNDGSYVRIDSSTVSTVLGGAPSLQGGGAFTDPGNGWLPGPVQISARNAPSALSAWPLQARSPLAAVTSEPGAAPGALTSEALAVGSHGVVERFIPGEGWQREFLLSGNGAVSSPNLRAVAWPEEGRAYAVGDLGAMWLWRQDTGLWEPDPAAPIDGFQANLDGIAFQPGNPALGYAVGRQGTLLRYDKTWTQEAVPAGAASSDFTSVAFAGSQALVAAGRDLLENSGSGWTIDPQVHALLASLPSAPTILTVAGLPDGGAVAAGHDIVLERDSAGGPWRVSDQPLPDATVVAAAAVRGGARVSAVVSVQPLIGYPPSLPTVINDPNSPPVLIPPNPLPASGYVLRETANGWADDEQTAFAGATDDKPIKSDPIAAFDLAADGSGWAIGGWSGEADETGRGSSASGSEGATVRSRVSTAGAYRYQPAGGPAPTPIGAAAAPVSFPAGQANFLVGGHAACSEPCARLANDGIAPDQNLLRMMSVANGLIGQPNGPRAFLYTGGRLDTGALDATEANRFASLFTSQPGVPVFSAVSRDESGGSRSAFASAFAGFPAPFGTGAAPGNVSTGNVPASPGAQTGVRTHYAFDSTGATGTVRVIVIDNSRGSLAASDPDQNPAEPQAPWLAGQLSDAKQRGIPAIVMGSRDLNSGLAPQINVASDADAEAKILADGGASAYLYERPEETRASRIPAGAATTLPEYGTGALGYRSPLQNTSQPNQPDALFGQTGYLLVSVDGGHRDPATNVAPVTAQLEPLLSDLALQAEDGNLLRRSRPALFQALGRRPIAGDRWGPSSAGDATPNPPGADPYTTFPPQQCLQADCAQLVTPQYRFTSSRPDIANFVAQDPNSTDLRKPLQNAGGKVVPDASSGLLCAFNAGTTTVTATAGGLSASLPVTVLAGSVEQPCGTTRLLTVPTQPSVPTTVPPPVVVPIKSIVPPPPVPAASPPPPPAPPPAKPVPTKPIPAPHVVLPIPPLLAGASSPQLAVSNGVISAPPPPGGAFARPIPPGGAVIRVHEEKREEEAAPEQSQAFSAYHPDEGPGVPLPPFILGVVVIGALAGTGLRAGLGRRDRRHEAAIAAARLETRQQQRRRSRR